jgi:ribosomal protein S27AE
MKPAPSIVIEWPCMADLRANRGLPVILGLRAGAAGYRATLAAKRRLLPSDACCPVAMANWSHRVACGRGDQVPGG